MSRSRPAEYRPAARPPRPGLRVLLRYLLLPPVVAAALATAGTWLLHQLPRSARTAGSLGEAVEAILTLWVYLRLHLIVFGAALGLMALSPLVPARRRPATQWAVALIYAGVLAYLTYALQMYRLPEVWLWLMSGLLGLLLPLWLERRAARQQSN